MLSFRRMSELIDNHRRLTENIDDGDYNAKSQVIRKGLQMRDDEDTFWQDLSSLASSNSESLAKLLGVKPNQIRQWPTLINDMLAKVKDEDSQSAAEKSPSLLKTGKDNGNADLSNPNGGGIHSPDATSGRDSSPPFNAIVN